MDKNNTIEKYKRDNKQRELTEINNVDSQKRRDIFILILNGLSLTVLAALFTYHLNVIFSVLYYTVSMTLSSISDIVSMTLSSISDIVSDFVSLSYPIYSEIHYLYSTEPLFAAFIDFFIIFTLAINILSLLIKILTVDDV